MTHENNDDRQQRQLPLRGLALVLVAVALLLGLWAVYALTSDDDDKPAADEAASSTESSSSTSTTSSEAPDEDKDSREPESEDGAEEPTEGSDPEGGDSPDQGAGDQGEDGPDDDDLTVNVLNNSTVGNLARDTADRLRETGAPIGEVGNLPEERLRLTETTVFFAEGNAAAEDAARRLADALGGVARPHDGALDEAVRGPEDVTVVLAG
ncbi:LytR C-terminal domain-containing protein [Corynebacterium otitidis]